MLLADVLYSYDFTKTEWGWKIFKGVLKDAQKFYVQFDPSDIVESMAAAASTRQEFLNKFVRLPFDPCWIEWNEEPVGGREGALCYLEGQKIYILWFYQLPTGELLSYGGAAVTSSYDDWGLISVDTSTYSDAAVSKLNKAQQIEFADSAIISIQRAYWTLALLNGKNVTEQSFVQIKEPVTKRRMNKNLPLYSHHVVNLKFGVSPQSTASASRTDSTGGITRAHLVRGHFKVRKTGLYWWSPFARGNAKKGLVTHDYELSD